MLTKMFENKYITKENERNNNNSKNVATKVVLVRMYKNKIENMKLVM